MGGWVRGMGGVVALVSCAAGPRWTHSTIEQREATFNVSICEVAARNELGDSAPDQAILRHVSGCMQQRGWKPLP